MKCFITRTFQVRFLRNDVIAPSCIFYLQQLLDENNCDKTSEYMAISLKLKLTYVFWDFVNTNFNGTLLV